MRSGKSSHMARRYASWFNVGHMKSDIRVATPPPKPLMVFDGDCNFCTLWIRRWQQMTGDAVDYLPSQDAGDRHAISGNPAGAIYQLPSN